MTISNLRELLDALITGISHSEVRAILESIGDYADVGLDQPFGPMKFSWHAFGNNPSNLSTIGLGTKPGRSLTERVTNAIDALLEDRVAPNVALPPSPRAAAQQWYGRPVSGPSDGLFNWSFGEHGYDRRIAVVMNNSGIGSAPTIDVVDEGIGIAAAKFPQTILSLQSGNKITKWFLIGAFGQGGAATLAFCDYAVIISRDKDDPRQAGFTVIRVLNLNETYKEDSWAYLCLRDSGGNIQIPSCDIGTSSLNLYPSAALPKLPSLSKGTLVRHIGYRLTHLDGNLGPSPGNLYHYLHVSMFDPLLPFRIIDLRESAKARDELVTGSRNRLMKLVKAAAANAGNDEDAAAGSEIKHYREMEYVVPLGGTEPCIGIEYWVVLNYRKGQGARRDDLVLRSQSNELYVNSNYPIVGTLNGQNQGELGGQLLRDIGLGMVSRHIVVHLDTSKANSRTRRELFATSREGFKDGPVLADLMRVLRTMLEEDGNLFEIERELTERIVKRESQSTNDEVKRQVTRLLLEAGYHARREGPATAPGNGGERELTRPARPRKPMKFDPLPTLPFPQVTRFEIVTPKPQMSIHLNDIEVVLVETDADSEFDTRGLIAIRCEPPSLEVATQSPLRGGRIRWRLRPKSSAEVGEEGRIIVTVTRPDGTQLSDSTGFVVLESLEERAKKSKGQVPPFDIIPINPDDDPEQWGLVWPTLAEAPFESQREVSYKPIKTAEGIVVYYSTIFGPYAAQIEKLKNDSEVLAGLFRTNYEVWIAYHAILQENSRTNGTVESIGADAMDKILEGDRVRVAQMQVKEAMQTADLMRKLIREKSTAASEMSPVTTG